LAQAKRFDLTPPPPDVLGNEVNLAQEVRRILSLGRSEASRLIGDTTKTAYRRIHEVVSSALDRVAESKGFDPGLLLDLSKSLILVKYQLAREQISSGIAEYIERILTTIIDVAGKNWENARRLAKNARTLLDSLAVLVYMYAE